MPHFINITVLSLLALWLLVPVSLLVMAGVSARASTPASLKRAWQIGRWLTASALVASLAVGGLLVLDALGVPTGLPEAPAAGLVSGWFGRVDGATHQPVRHGAAFAENYWGDRGERRFLPWCLVVLASVMLLVFTHHLVVMLIAWVG